MAAALLITLRETLEASLVVGIMLAFLHRTANRDRNPIVWAGVGAGVLTSVIAALIVFQFGGGFSGRAEKVYEGITMLVAAGLITWMVIWLAVHGRHMREAIERKIEVHLAAGELLSLFLLVFTSILREGIETVIFLQAAFLQSQDAAQHVGAIAGMMLAVGTAWLLFHGMMRWFSLRRFFTFTGILLMLFAAGLVAHGVHELQEAGLVVTIIEHVWDSNWLINEASAVGSLLKGLLGYNGSPSLFEVISYALYIVLVGITWKRVNTLA